MQGRTKGLVRGPHLPLPSCVNKGEAPNHPHFSCPKWKISITRLVLWDTVRTKIRYARDSLCTASGTQETLEKR